MRLVLHPIGVIPGIHGIQQEVSTMIQRRRLGLATCLTLAVGLLLAGPTAAASNHGLHLTVTSFEFGSFDCVDIVCTGRADGFATSNLAGDGTIQWELVTTFFDGFDSNCNHVDEIGRFTFGDDSMTLVSHHTDCRLQGQRVKTTFDIVDGTGRFAGATGGGLEIAGPEPFTYNGAIQY
jgi:hypothetical protein